MVTYDMASDSRLANSRTIKDLAHSWKKVKYHLKTAVGEKIHHEYQGQLHILRQQGSTLKLTFIGVEGNGVLHKQSMPPVQLPVECITRGWDLSHRSVNCDYHILMDAGSVEHFPEKVLYKNKTGSTLILQSKLTGRGIPMGLFKPATSSLPEWTTYDQGPQNEAEVMGWDQTPPSHRRTQQTSEDTEVPDIFNNQDGPHQEPGYRSANQPIQHLPCNWRPSKKKKFNFPINKEPARSTEVTDLQTSTKNNVGYNLNKKTGSHGHGPRPGTIKTLVTQRQRRPKARKRKLQEEPGTTSVPRLVPGQYQTPVLHSNSSICTGETTPDDQQMKELDKLLKTRELLRQELTELEMEEASGKGGNMTTWMLTTPHSSSPHAVEGRISGTQRDKTEVTLESPKVSIHNKLHNCCISVRYCQDNQDLLTDPEVESGTRGWRDNSGTEDWRHWDTRSTYSALPGSTPHQMRGIKQGSTLPSSALKQELQRAHTTGNTTRWGEALSYSHRQELTDLIKIITRQQQQELVSPVNSPPRSSTHIFTTGSNLWSTEESNTRSGGLADEDHILPLKGIGEATTSSKKDGQDNGISTKVLGMLHGNTLLPSLLLKTTSTAGDLPSQPVVGSPTFYTRVTTPNTTSTPTTWKLTEEAFHMNLPQASVDVEIKPGTQPSGGQWWPPRTSTLRLRPLQFYFILWTCMGMTGGSLLKDTMDPGRQQGLNTEEIPHTSNQQASKEGELLHRVVRMIFNNKNEFNFRGKSEFALFKYNSEVNNANNYYGNFYDRPTTRVGTINQMNNPSPEALRVMGGKECVLFVGASCALSDDINNPQVTEAQRMQLLKSADYSGSSLMQASFNDFQNVPAGFSQQWSTPAPPTVDYIPVPAIPYRNWTEELEDKPEDLQVQVCNSVDLASEIQETHNFMDKYKHQLMRFLGSPLAPQGYLPSLKGEGWERRGVFKIGNPLWTMWDTKESDLLPMSLPELSTMSHHLIKKNCEHRGGSLPEITSSTEHQDLRRLCDEDKLNCGSLLLAVNARGRDLTWSSSGRAVVAKFTDKFRSIFYNETDPSVQVKFNTLPFIMLSWLGSREFFMPQKGNEVAFPVAEETRSLCIFGQDHPSSIALSMKLRFLDDVLNKTLDAVPHYMKKLASLRQFIYKFNQMGSPEESHSRALLPPNREKRESTKTDCLDSTVRLLDGSSYREDLLQRFRLSPDQVRTLVDRLKIFGSLQSRDFLDDQQSERYTEELGARAALSKIQKLIPVFLDEARNWANTVDGVFDLVPEDLKKLEIAGQSMLGLFNGPQETETLISTTLGLLISLLMNFLSLALFIYRHKHPKKMVEEEEEQQKKVYQPKGYPQEELQPLVPSAPSPISYQPALQMMTMPASHMSYQPRQNPDRMAHHMAYIMRQM
jgi:hypothetical protein